MHIIDHQYKENRKKCYIREFKLHLVKIGDKNYWFFYNIYEFYYKNYIKFKNTKDMDYIIIKQRIYVNSKRFIKF
jgi:hypothetical protein